MAKAKKRKPPPAAMEKPAVAWLLGEGDADTVDPIEWLRGWMIRLEAWAQEDTLPLYHWRMALWPDRNAEQAITDLEPTYPHPIRRLTDALREADQLVKNGEVTTENLTEWISQINYRPEKDEVEQFILDAKSPRAEDVAKWLEVVMKNLRTIIGAVEDDRDRHITLSKREQDFISTLARLGASDSEGRKPTKIIVASIDRNNDPNGWGDVVALLVKKRLIHTKTGRGGGSWLTSDGVRRSNI